MSEHITDTSTATIHVSNIPDAPLPILRSRVSNVTPPITSIITIPEIIPVIRTTKTFTPIIPPASTSTYGII